MLKNNNSIRPTKSFSEFSGYDEYDAESRLPFRSVPTQMMTHKVATRDDHDIDLTKSTIYNSNGVDTQYAIRPGQAPKHLLKCISNDWYRVASVFAVIIALFAFDFSRTISYSSFDTVIEYTLSFIFVFLMLDCIAQCIVYKSYPASFFFWLDLIGTVTLLADLSYTYSIFGYTQADLTVARGGRAGRAARTATTLRISKMVMWVRVTRLIRLARVLRQFRLMIQNKFRTSKQTKANNKKRSPSATSDILNIPGGSNESDMELSDMVTSTNTRKNSQIMPKNKNGAKEKRIEDDSSQFSLAENVREAHSSRIGVRVADSITRNVVFGILLTVCLVPIFNNVDEESYSAMYLAMDIFNEQYSASSSSLETTIGTFLDSMDAQNVYYLSVGDVNYMDNIAVADGLRATECLEFFDENVEIKLDISKNKRISHGMAIGFTCLVVSLFASLAFMISKNIEKSKRMLFENRFECRHCYWSIYWQ